MDPGKGLFGSDSSGGKAAATFSSGRSAATLGALHGNATAQDWEESDATHSTKKPRIGDDADMGSTRGMLQKQSPKVEADSCSSVDTPLEHPAEEADTAKGIQESDSDEIVHAKKQDTRLREVEDLIKEMDACGIGEQISGDEFLGYFEGLACDPPWTDLDVKLEDKDICEKENLHGVHRLKYLQHKVQSTTLILTYTYLSIFT